MLALAETIVIKAASADNVADGMSETFYSAEIENLTSDNIPTIFGLDIYPSIKPSDPGRHLGWWNVELMLPPGTTRVTIKRREAEAEILTGDAEKPVSNSWQSGFKEDGLYDVSFVVYGTGAGKPIVIAKAVRKQVLVFSGINKASAAERYWPERARRRPSLSMPDYVTLASLTVMIKDFAENHCPAGSALLDIGCGSKPYLPFFIGRVAAYTGLDLMPTEFADVVASSEKLPFPDDRFNVVISTQVFEHIPEPAKTTQEMLRVLKPGGFAFVSLPFVWEEHDVPYDFWRYAGAGAKRTFSRFDLISIRSNGTTYQSLMQLKNLYWHKSYRRDRLTIEKKLVFCVRNLWATLAGRLTKDVSLTPNYTLVLQKPTNGRGDEGAT